MEYYDTIIVGGGPAGSSCAWQLQRHGHRVLVLDRASFPRLKLCGGWISTGVMNCLEFTPADYPHSIMKMPGKLYFSPFSWPLVASWMLPWRTDYSIRRIEFDHWLLQRSQSPVKVHSVKKIDYREGVYIIDDRYRCQYLVGAGGSSCPVRRTFFPNQPRKPTQIATIEHEFLYPDRDNSAHLFFGYHGLKGYSWYAPKADGFVNIGLAGSTHYFQHSETNIQTHFRWLLEDLVRHRLLDRYTSQTITGSGHGFSVFIDQGQVKQDNCYLIGDAAGLATLDLAEGIHPAVQSGLLAANDILGRGEYTKATISRFSLNPAFHWLQRIWDFSPID